MKLFYTTAPTDSRAFTAKILREYYGIAAPEFQQTEHGKPCLLNAPLFFNLSHSGNITALAIAKQEVGLDIQERTERAFPAALSRLTPAERAEDFFALWTAKEAYIKYKGGSLAKMLSALEYCGGVLYENGAPVNAHLLRFELKDCAACVCSARSEEVKLIEIG